MRDRSSPPTPLTEVKLVKECAETGQPSRYLGLIREVEGPLGIYARVADPDSGRWEFLAGRGSVRLHRDVQRVLALHPRTRRQGADDRKVCQRVGIGHDALIYFAALQKQPTAEVLEAVVGTPTVDDVGGSPKGGPIGISHQAPQDL